MEPFVKYTALNAEIVARTKDIQEVWNFYLFKKVFYS